MCTVGFWKNKLFPESEGLVRDLFGFLPSDIAFFPADVVIDTGKNSQDVIAPLNTEYRGPLLIVISLLLSKNYNSV